MDQLGSINLTFSLLKDDSHGSGHYFPSCLPLLAISSMLAAAFFSIGTVFFPEICSELISASMGPYSSYFV